jgi:hypothetical protein
MRALFSAFTLLACIGAVAVVASAQSWCGTPTTLLPSLLRNGQGCRVDTCDDPAVRDTYLVHNTSSWLTVRLLIHVLANDNGQYPAATADVIERGIALLQSNYAPWRIRFVATTETIRDTALNTNSQFYIDSLALMREFTPYALNPTHA